MLFNSLQFLIFFPVVTLGYFALPGRFRWAWLLAASCLFYMAFIPIYILILLLTIVIDYWAGLFIERAQGARRKLLLTVSLVTNVGVLAVFKYYNFFVDSLNALASTLGAHSIATGLSLILPIGLSFHTFQAMSYTIEVYRGNQRAERHFGIYALYVMFYPQLVAGPIERPQNMLHQFHSSHAFSYENARDGLRMMLLGFVKKVVVADRLALIVDAAYSNPQRCSAPALAFATACFAFQIYADFSGYSDIAIGAARFMGFDLMTNFRRPYLSQSVGEFWRRWHISLSTWFRDYVYVPLGGNRVKVSRAQLNLLITFLISGLWHGANWTFVIWGGVNGLYLVTSNLTRSTRAALSARLRFPGSEALFRILRTAATFVLISIAWVFFRARSVSDAFYVLETMARGARELASVSAFRASLKSAGIDESLASLGLLLTAGLWLFDYVSERAEGKGWLDTQPTWRRWGLYYAALTLLLFLGKFGQDQFIYFQF